MLAAFISFVEENVGPIVALIGIFAGWLTLKANHEWNRRHYAMQMMTDWNGRTSVHRQAIEKAFPGLLDRDGKKIHLVEITKEQAQKIYASRPDESNWVLKHHLFEIGNHLEAVATAYFHHIADRQIIEEEFSPPLIRWHDAMENFIAVLAEHRSYRPWKQFDRAAEQWRRADTKPRTPTA